MPPAAEDKVDGSSSSEGAPPTRCLFVTQNITGVFDAMEEALDPWIGELEHLVEVHKPDFIALHFQEMGGTNWKEGGLRESAAPFHAALHKAFTGFWSSGLLCNLDHTEGFSALGSIYLVRLTAMERVQLWDFGNAEHPAGFRALADLPAPLLDAPCIPPRYCRHERFPQHFFAEYPNWSRKGFLLTRWQLGREELDLLNVHLFHDDSNLQALQRLEGETRSIYATRRFGALRHTLREVIAEQPSGGAARPSVFLFGDFNFRLDLPAVVGHLCGAHGLARAQAHAREAPAPLRLLTAEHEAGGSGGEAPDSGAPDSEVTLELGAKRFALTRPWELFSDRETALSFDRELLEYSGGGMGGGGATALLELERPSFKPTYMYIKETEGGKGKGDSTARQGMPARKTLAPSGVEPAFFNFGRKRCPSWCDRVLMDPSGLALVKRSPHTPTYDSVEQRPQILCDHNKVFLAFEVP